MINTYNLKPKDLIVHPIGGKKCASRSRCIVGDVVQPINEFGKRSNTPDGRSGTCKTCVNDRSRQHQKKRADNILEFKKYFS